ncbi:alpha-galactosidase [Marinilactibacillus sp. 15R]|uniref:alpha-galactosidase n=1 Tax=Marinilactibacillus sp. 15R TaxID=1911586 RepID=UPI00090C2E53|nr:alpha-galactosidase [Marinilactibacillus sp. 15R]API88715.1 alpha-galactosidase [Marinilactibacillus sp. 15R]
MNIKVEETITLKTENSQLTIGVLESGYVSLLYFGKKISVNNVGYIVEDIERVSYLADTDGKKDFKLEQIPQVYPAYGNPDLRSPAHKEIYGNGTRISDFRYASHSLVKEKPELNHLPHTQSDKKTETLLLTLRDKLTKNEIVITISAFEDYDMFSQSVKFINNSTETVQIEEMMSLNLDLLTDKLDLITLTGAWGRENTISRRRLEQGIQGIDSKRGASGHGQNPFIALVSPEANELSGHVIGCNLIYSGNFKACVEVDMHQNSRLQIGINPFEFSWALKPNESFDTPEVVFVTTENGLNDMSQKFHRFYIDCLLQSKYAKEERPVLLNCWEATYFDFDKEILIQLADEAKSLGIELFVVDDGWFGNRQDDTSSLGDWFPNEEKLGNLSELIKEIKSKGLSFGIWLEPEMVSPDSELYRRHPEWAIAAPGRFQQKVRHQYVLDLTNKEVQQYLIETIDKLLTENAIDYVKWDMNRNITDAYTLTLPADRQKEFSHRYILGLYNILTEITQKHPDVLFESCAGGGGRFDPGMLYYMPQTWTSDNTDAIARLSIQKGTSLIYPPISMGCHISSSPNHQVGRITPLLTRQIVAQQGNVGYEINLNKLSIQEKEEIKEFISEYKAYRNTIQLGKHYRLPVYDEQNEEAWMKKNLSGNEIIVSHVDILTKPNTAPKRLKLIDLEPKTDYLINNKDKKTGDELMQIGLALPKPQHDYFSCQWIIQKLGV